MLVLKYVPILSFRYINHLYCIGIGGAFKLPCNPCNAMGEHKLRKVGGAVRCLRVIHLVCLCQCYRMWHCSSSRHHGAMDDCLYQWTRDQGSIVTADCVTCCGQVPVMMVTSATGASGDLLRHEKNIINIYRAAGDHLPHRSSH